MYIPSSTYRIQFNKEFTFKNLKENLPYFSRLFPGAIYASPVFAAVPGSMHGYDVTNPLVINHEIGTLQEFEDICTFLKNSGMGWIQDIVPNHMAFHSDNLWLMDVLENGKQSPYASFFDIDFEHPDFNGKVMVPFLGKNLDEAFREKEIQLIWLDGKFMIEYNDLLLPLKNETFQNLLKNIEIPEEAFIGQSVSTEEIRQKDAFKGIGFGQMQERYTILYEEDASFRSYIDQLMESINSDPEKLSDIMAVQNYQLTSWQDVENHLNYRRFFTINGLICLKMEKDEVFDEYHKFIRQLIKEKMFQGLRIDHIDGLLDPNLYFEKLRSMAGDETYTVVEKILEQNEELERNWSIQGSSGYDFLAMVNSVFTQSANYPVLEKFYREITETEAKTEDIIYEKKKKILTQSLRGDWENLARMLENSHLVEYSKEITPVRMMEAIGEFLATCPVYKLYSDHLPLSPEDQDLVADIVKHAALRTNHLRKPLQILGNIFLQPYTDANRKNTAQEFFLRCMQYTGPLMAKGVEDTTMYSYACFIAHNEVGDSIDASGISAKKFHEAMKLRRKNLPLSMNATSTHDTKRGEDSRARLNVISEMPEEWSNLVRQWMQTNESYKTSVHGKSVPSVNEEYFIYQTLIGSIPMDGAVGEKLLERVCTYMQKALREAKINSDWNQPDTAYEEAVMQFIRTILNPDHPFILSFNPFLQKITYYGIVNSLSQLVLKCTCPGIPDFYQGTELWDLSLVDPDNRRPVNYDLRMSYLEEWQDSDKDTRETLFRRLQDNRTDGRIKMWLTNTLTRERFQDPSFFTTAEYIPLEVKGRFKEHVLAFARTSGNIWYITVIPLFLATLHKKRSLSAFNTIDWRNTSIELPDTAPANWVNLWDNSGISSTGEIAVSNLLQLNCPVVLKGMTKETGRSAGVLLHISSLPGKYATGDLGEEAYRFVDFLAESGQSYWQILPLNPVENSYSPYSSPSAFAGNPLFISPEILLRWRLIQNLPSEAGMDIHHCLFGKAEKIRKPLLEESFSSFKKQKRPLLQKRFEEFCQKEKYWLDDFVLFTILQKEFGNKSWDYWPEKVRDRDDERMKVAFEDHRQEIEQEKFTQFLFSGQWRQLKDYAHSKGIQIIGDMSFYVSYNSAELWSNPHLFKLNDQKRMISVAGVPPDYFSETGQLWNMPVYNWEIMKKDNFAWWKNRISRNLEFCDLVRFDHFRGLSAYWEVPSEEKTAVNGEWIKGPGHDFFTAIRKEFPSMPFIAEDLGEIDEDVYKLRDDYKLPGMKVLQFAFGHDMPASVHIPHMHEYNSIVYTGTHDNNTIRGWYKKDLDDLSRKNIQAYTSRRISSADIPDEFIRMAYSSVSRIAIIPMQDVLSLDNGSRLNNPGQAEKNWTWKLVDGDIREEDSERLRYLVWLYGRK